MKAALSLLALSLTLAACVPATRAPAPTTMPPPPTVARPAPATPPPVVQAIPSDNWMDTPATPGDWRYARQDGSSVAEFLSPGNERLAAIYCGSDRQVTIAVYGAGSGPMTIRTETATRTQAATASGMFTRTQLSARDPLLDAMALSKGRFAVEVDGSVPLYLPSWAEVSRVIEDCREGA